MSTTITLDESHEKFGKVVYDGYRAKSDNKSLISGHPIPEWELLPEDIQNAWIAGAYALILMLAECDTKSQN